MLLTGGGELARGDAIELYPLLLALLELLVVRRFELLFNLDFLIVRSRLAAAGDCALESPKTLASIACVLKGVGAL